MATELLDRRETRIRTMFGGIAPWYDTLNHVLSLNIDRYWRWRTTRLAPLVDDSPMLDVCTGTGDLAFAYLRSTKSPVSIVGSDFCRPMLERAVRKSAKRRGGDRVSFVEADAQELPFADNMFQLVTVAFGLRNVTNYERGLAEMARVAKPGGRVAILEFSKPRHPVFGRLYRFYFTSILPRIGQCLSKSQDSAYSYLPASVMQFPDYEALADLMRGHGLSGVQYHPMTLGIATLYIGTKQVAT